MARITKDQWDEIPITWELIELIRERLNRVRIEDEFDVLKLSTCIYKMKGRLETRYGDLAVIVRIKFRDGRDLTGVALYEAKKRKWGTSTLASIVRGQLDRIYRNSWQARLLIYDYEGTPVRSACAPAGTLSFVHAMHLAYPVELKMLDTSLYRFAAPFAFQLCRNLHGIDIDLDGGIVEQVRSGAVDRGAPTFVVAVVVVHGDGVDADATEIEVNKEVYEPQ